MNSQVTLEQAVHALRTMYGETWENGFEDGKDDMTETLEEQFHIPKHEARQLVEGLIAARTIRWQGGSEALPAAENQAANIQLINGHWTF